VSHVYRPYPTPQLPRPGAALLPAGGGSVPLSSRVAAVAAGAESPTPQLRAGIAALLPPVSAPVPLVAVRGFARSDYPVQEVLLEPIAPIATPTGAAYVFTGLPFQPASVQRPDLIYPNQEPLIEAVAPMATPPGAAYIFGGALQAALTVATYRVDIRTPQPALGAAAVLDDTVLVVVGDAVPMPNAYDRAAWPIQMPASSPAAVMAPTPSAWLPPRGIAIVARMDAPAVTVSAAPIAAFTTPAGATYVFTGLPFQGAAFQRYELGYPSQEPLLEAVAPFVGPPPASVPVANVSGQGWRADYPTQEPSAESVAPFAGVAAAALTPYSPVLAANQSRLDAGTQISVRNLAPFTAPSSFIGPTLIPFWFRETAGAPQTSQSAALLDALQAASYIAPRPLATAHRVDSQAIQPIRLLAAILSPNIIVQLARGETIEATQDDDRRIYPTRLN
jgi:hypothetical protein